MDHLEAFDADELIALASHALHNGDLEGGLLKLKHVVQREEPPFEALGLLAQTYAKLSLYEKARACYRRCIEAAPQAPLPRFELGMTHFDAGDPQRAEALWTDLLKEHPDYPPVLYYLALINAQDNRPEEAQRLLERLFKVAPADNLFVQRGGKLAAELNEAPAAADAPIQH